jgi:hypothetical protein
MSYDVAFRFQQALDPSALTTIPGALHGITAAIDDCRRAGKPTDSDPAVLLLVRHLGSLAADAGDSDSALRIACLGEISDMRRKPVLNTLALRGVSYDATAKKLFQSEARRALRQLADALGYDKSDYDLRICAGGPAVGGEVILHSNEVYIQVTCDGQGGDVLYRRCRDRRDYIGERNHVVAMRELTNAGALAQRICRDLSLAMPAFDDRLVA